MIHIRNSNPNAVYILVNAGIPVSTLTDFNEPIANGSLCIDTFHYSLYQLRNNNWYLVQGGASTSGGILGVFGTTNRIIASGGSTPVVDISPNYIGQSTITTLGTIINGRWNGSSIHDNFISSSSNWNSKQNALTGHGFVKVSGTSGISYDNTKYITSNETITLTGDISGSGTSGITTIIGNNKVSYSKIQHVSSNRILGRVGSLGNIQELSVTSGLSLSGLTLGLSNSGVITGTYNTVVVNSNGIITSASSKTYLTGNQTITVSGDVSGSGSTGLALTLANTGIIAGTYNDITFNNKGLATNGSNKDYITNQNITLSGDISGSGSSGISTTIGNNVVSYAKIQTVSANKLLGRVGSLGNIQELAVTSGLSFSGITLGLSNSGVIAGTYNNVTVNSKGIITSGSNKVLDNNLITLSGDISGSGTAGITTTISNNVVSYTKIQTVSGNKILGRVGSLGNVQELSVTSGLSLSGLTLGLINSGVIAGTYNDITFNNKGIATSGSNKDYITNQNITLSGDISGSGTAGITTTIGNNKVSYAKIQTVSGNKLLGNPSGVLGNIQELSVTSGLSLSGLTIGLTNSGIVSGTYNFITFNNKGIATSASSKPYLTGNQTITVSGDATGSGSTGLALTLANSGVSSGTYNNVTVNSKGLATNGSNKDYITNQNITLSGDISGSGSSGISTTIGNNVVTYTKIQQVSGNKILGNPSGILGNVKELALTSGLTLSGNTLGLSNSGVVAGTYNNVTVNSKGIITTASNKSYGSTQIITLTGDISGSGTAGIATTIGNNKVSYAKIQTVSGNKLLGRVGSLGNIQELSVTSGLSLSGLTLGINTTYTNNLYYTKTLSDNRYIRNTIINTPSILFNTPVSNSTTSGTQTFNFTLKTQSPNTFLAGSTSGTITPTFRKLALSDMPTLTGYSSASGLVNSTDTAFTAIQKLDANTSLLKNSIGSLFSDTFAVNDISNYSPTGALVWTSSISGGVLNVPTGTGSLLNYLSYNLCKVASDRLTVRTTMTVGSLNNNGVYFQLGGNINIQWGLNMTTSSTSYLELIGYNDSSDGVSNTMVASIGDVLDITFNKNGFDAVITCFNHTTNVLITQKYYNVNFNTGYFAIIAYGGASHVVNSYNVIDNNDANVELLIIGDSITSMNGYMANENETWVKKIQDRYAGVVKLAGGQDVFDTSTAFYKMVDKYKPKRIAYFTLANNFGAGASSFETTYASIISTFVGKGYQAIICTPLDRSTFTTTVNTITAWMYSNYAGYTIFNTNGALNMSSIQYSADYTHPNRVGNEIFADYWNVELSNILPLKSGYDNNPFKIGSSINILNQYEGPPSICPNTIANTDTSITITSFTKYENKGYVLLRDNTNSSVFEIAYYSGNNSNGITGLRRGLFGTTALSIASGNGRIQGCKYMLCQNDSGGFVPQFAVLGGGKMLFNSTRDVYGDQFTFGGAQTTFVSSVGSAAVNIMKNATSDSAFLQMGYFGTPAAMRLLLGASNVLTWSLPGGFTLLNSDTSQNITLGFNSSVFRTTNAGSDVTSRIAFSPSRSITAGVNYYMDVNNGLVIGQGNGTRNIAGVAFKGINLTATAGSEAMDLGIYTQTGGTALSLRATINANGINTTLGFQTGYSAKTAIYTIQNSDYTIECTANTFTVTLPTAVGIAGKVFVIKNTGLGVITVATTSAQTIDGQTTKVLATQFSGTTVQSNGSNYIVLSTL